MCRSSTESSKYVWKLKDGSITPMVTSKVVAKVFFDSKYNSCKICLTEKVLVIYGRNGNV